MAKNRLVSVDFSSTSPYAGLHYAFKTSIKATESTALGHTALTGTSPLSGLIYRANAPKPPKATKRLADGSTSTSYIDDGAYVSAAAAGWQLIASKRSGGRRRKTRRTTVVYVTVNNVKYAWNIRDVLLAKIKPSLDALGVKIATPETDCVFGAAFPKPPTVKIFTAQGDEEITASTFYDPSNDSALTANYETTAGRYTLDHWASVAL
jgi:hypothetical protein